MGENLKKIDHRLKSSSFLKTKMNLRLDVTGLSAASQEIHFHSGRFLVVKRFCLSLIFADLVLLLSLALVPRAVLSWTEPSESPPGGNVAAPLNTSGTGQTKSGRLEIGTTTPILNPGLPYALNLESNSYPLVLTDPNAGAGNKRWGLIFGSDSQGKYLSVNRAADDLGGANQDQVRFYRSGETEFRGGVGINTKPTYPTFLEIAGNAIDEPWIVFRPVQANHIGAIDVRSGDGLGIKMNGAEAARITSSGNFSVRTPGENNYLFLETANNPGQYYDIGAFGSNSFQPLRIDGSKLLLQTRSSGAQSEPGKVGIGTTDPKAKLQVNDLTTQNDLSTNKGVTANYIPGFGILSVITDGVFVPEGTRWNDCLDWSCPPNSTRSVQLNDSGSNYALTIDLNGTHNISKIKIQADVNDTYIIEYSPDGTNWSLLYKVSEDWDHIVEGGLRTREFELLNKVSAQYVKVYAYDKGAGHEYGDDYLSVSELQVFENSNALAVTDQGRIGLGTTNPKSRLQINDNYNIVAGKTATLNNPSADCSANPVSINPSAITEITDGQYAAEGADWRDIKAIWLYFKGGSPETACYNATLTIDLGDNYDISGAKIQADSGDSYIVEYSPDGNTWSELFTAPPGNGGLSTRASESLSEGLKKVSAHYVRVRMTGGDGRFSVSELEILQSPIPNTFMVTDQGKVGIGTEPSAKLTVTTNLGKIGSLGDTLYAYANSTNAAISAEQTNASGWAGHFSGKVNVTDQLSAGQLCLSGTCMSDWSSIAGLWKQEGTGISPNQAAWNVGIGATPAGAKLTVGATGTAIEANSTNTNAIYGKTNAGTAIYGESIGAGRAGYFTAGNTSTQDTLAALSSSATKSALYAQQNNASGWAGYFSGKVKVAGNLYATSNLYAGVSGNDASFSYDAGTKTLTLGSIIIAQGPSQLAIANGKLALVGPISKCNNNGICEPPENPQFCPKDCLKTEPAFQSNPPANNLVGQAQVASFIPAAQAATADPDKIIIEGGNIKINNSLNHFIRLMNTDSGAGSAHADFDFGKAYGVRLSAGTAADIQSWGNQPLFIQNIGQNTYINAQNGGQVTIGTDTPDSGGAKLTVNGGVKASVFYDDITGYYADLNTGGNLGGNWTIGGNIYSYTNGGVFETRLGRNSGEYLTVEGDDINYSIISKNDADENSNHNLALKNFAAGTGNQSISFWTQNNGVQTEAVKIDGSGSVGIGTTGAIGQKLAVNGNIKVDNWGNWIGADTNQSWAFNQASITTGIAVGIGGTPGAKLTVTANSGKTGSSGDTLYAYANSADAAISAEQAGSGWAGYFSGKVGITGGLTIGGISQRGTWNGRTPINNTTTLIDGSGTSPSMTIGADSLPIITYAASGLKVAKCTNTDCTNKSITTVNPSGDYPSITIGTDGLPIIAYDDSGVKVIKCTNTDCTNKNAPVTIASGSLPSIIIGSDGNPTIVYRASSIGLVKCTSADCTNKNAPVTIHSGTYAYIGAPSITNSADGNPAIAFEVKADPPTTTKLRFSKCTTVDCAAPPAGIELDSISVFYVYSIGTSSITIGTDGFPIIAYSVDAQQTGGASLRVAKCLSVDCAGSSPMKTTIESGIWWPSPGRAVSGDSSITIGTDGFPIIAYYYSSAGYGLKVVKCSNQMCSVAAPGNILKQIDSGTPTNNYPSIAIGADGLPIIAYSASGLKIARCGSDRCFPWTRR